MMYQRSQSKWLREGDGNSKFFHSCVKSRIYRKGIETLMDGEAMVHGVGEIRRVVVDYFRNHVSYLEWERPKLDGVNFKNISEEDNRFLIEPFSMREIELVVKTSVGNKSPGPDRFNFAFFKQFWYLVKN